MRATHVASVGAIIPGQHGPRVAFEDDQTPPVHAVEGEVHPAPVNEPILMPRLGFIRVGPWGRLHPTFRDMGDVVIHQPVQGHHAPDGPHGDVCPRQQAPDPKLPRVRMGLLEVIDLHHQR